MTEQSAILTALVAERYGLSEVTLESISPYTFEGRGIYRVRGRDGSMYVLRAFRDDVTASLERQVAVLDLLRQRRFPAPAVRYAKDGAAIARFRGWTALLVTYTEGNVASFIPEDVEALAGYLGRLHNLSRDVAKGELAAIPLAPTHPSVIAVQALSNLNVLLTWTPNWLKQFCHDSIASVRAVHAANHKSLLPEALIHGDCWPANAVKGDDGRIVLVDWDRAGAGPAFLDLCYLLLTCHLGKPQLPAMEPDEELIAAAVRGYCRQRRPNAAELNLLDQCLLYDVGLRLSQRISTGASDESLAEDEWIQKLLARYRACPQVAEIARRCFG